jgi:hypothetical protein
VWPADDNAARQDEVLNGRTQENWDAWMAAASAERERYCDTVRRLARNCTSILLDNVAEYVDKQCPRQCDDENNVTSDMENVYRMFHSGLSIRPPFDLCLLEWCAPQHRSTATSTPLQCGAWCRHTWLTDATSSLTADFERLWWLKRAEINNMLDSGVYDADTSSECAAHRFLETTQPPTSRLHSCITLEPMFVYLDDNRLQMLHALEYIYLDQQGRPLLSGYRERTRVGVRKYFDAMSAPLINTVATVGLAYMNIKNVENVDVTAATNAEMLADMPPRKKWQPKRELPPVRYRTINILPMGGARKADGASSDETQGVRARHICRGHMATYTEERPLFGKYVGTYWIPAHVRGDKKHGEVIKNYSVQPAPLQTAQTEGE